MFPKKVIVRYIGDNTEGIVIGGLSFKPGSTMECVVNEEIFNQILSLADENLVELFVFASAKEIDGLRDDLNSKADYFKTEMGIIYNELDVVDTEIQDILGEIELVNNDLFSKEEEMKNLALSIDTLNNELSLVKEDILGVNNDILKVNEDIVILRRSIADTDSQVSEVLREVGVSNNNIAAILNTLKDIEVNYNQEMTSIKERLSALENI